ncbi:MAG TPA: kelch repeat-containing protein [Planctomycetota bacterium]|nr:kelch repeat-containing protein [Planctomycetota bacterium]
MNARILVKGGLPLALWLGACGPDLDPSGAAESRSGAPPEPASQPPRAAGQADWEKIHAGGVAGRDSPAAGEDAALAYDGARHRVLLYGGKGDDDATRNELWSFDLGTRHWTRIDPEGPSPPLCEDHTLVLDTANEQLVLFGGESGATSRAAWTYDLRANRWADITQDTTPALEGHVAVYDPRGRRMIVFGGMAVKFVKKDKKEKTLEEETWVLDLNHDSPGYGAWSVLPVGENRPSPRREHRGVYDPVRHRLIVFGGRQRSSTSFLNDVWALDLESRTWREIETRGERPDPIRQMAFAYDPRANALTVFGGEVLVAFGPSRAEHFTVNQVWVLDLETGLWSDRTPYPRPMYDHVGVFVPEYGGTMIYGGSSNRPGKEHSTWLLRTR